MKRQFTVPKVRKRNVAGDATQGKVRQPKCVVVVPGRRPELAYDDPWDVAKEHIASTLDACRYPQQYNRTDTLRLLLDDNGIYKATAYNCWGIVGPFVIYRMSMNGCHLSLPQSLVDDILEDLEDVDGGLLDSMSNIACPFVEAFARYGIPPAGWVPTAGKWFGN
jgi:hypothetical protein